jgi:pimeloyl-ACP methyl ester carboxylesterase
MAAQRLVPVGDVELCVERFGDPAEPAVLLVSGAAASMDWWDVELCGRLAESGRHVIRYDHRDTGRSTTGIPGTPAYGGWQLGHDCADLIGVLGSGPVHLVGISMGGGIGQLVAIQRPELLASLTLVSTTAVGGVDVSSLPGPSPEVSAFFAAARADPDWGDVDSYVDWVVAGESVFAGEAALDESRVRATAATVHARSIDPAAAGNHWLVVGSESDGEKETEPLDVRRISTPTLVVHGSDDPLFPLPHGRALAEAIPGATFLAVPGMGHQVPPPETWDVVIPALVRHTGAIRLVSRPLRSRRGPSCR